MKTIVGILVMILLMTIAVQTKAQTYSNDYMTITYQNYKDGAYNFNIVGLNLGGNYTWSFTVSDNLSNPSYSTNWAGGNSSQGSTKFSITAAQLSNAVITFHVTSVYSGANGSDITFVFGNLPITLTSFTAQVQSDGVHFAWSTAQELNVDHYEVWDVTDTVHNVLVGAVNTQAKDGNSTSPLSYTFLLPIAHIVESGFGIAVILGLMLGMICENRKMLIPTACLLVIAVSCTKTSLTTLKTKQTKVYQLREIDKDGTTHFMQNEVAVQVMD